MANISKITAVTDTYDIKDANAYHAKTTTTAYQVTKSSKTVTTPNFSNGYAVITGLASGTTFVSSISYSQKAVLRSPSVASETLTFSSDDGILYNSATNGTVTVPTSNNATVATVQNTSVPTYTITNVNAYTAIS